MPSSRGSLYERQNNFPVAMVDSNHQGATAATIGPDGAENKYRSLVIDSGPIIRLTGISSLREKAHSFFTVPEVLNEIRDAKARHHLQNLPFEIVTRDPSAASIQAVTDFARLTGDYRSLSRVDMLVLALVYELEKEGCGGSTEHIRSKPKRTCGVGKIELLNPKAKSTDEEQKEDPADLQYDIVEDDEEDDDIEEEEEGKEPSSLIKGNQENSLVDTPLSESQSTAQAPKSWAMLVNPNLAAEGPVSCPASDGGGQFDDVEGEENVVGVNEENNSDVETELRKDFPSLAASLHVPYESDDDESCNADETGDENRKTSALEPLSKSGKVYNSFRGYNKLFKPTPKIIPVNENNQPQRGGDEEKKEEQPHEGEPEGEPPVVQSRIMGGVALSCQEMDIEDDGEGWVTSTRDIHSLKAAGTLAPPVGAMEKVASVGPPVSQRAACATTDFAMQNVLLQMNLELLSVDGVKIRRLKTWVTRCGCCFRVYTKVDDSGPHGMKRLFCERCGSDMLQRIAASVDGKTGRLRLHMSKKHKKSTRGTKFSLPKPGSGDRFQGDLLLTEDQLMFGAWNQKVKMRSGGKAKGAAQSMFGQDIAANVGCKARSMNVDDISAGFGRRNPNAAKGRERRGKKKKSKQKACGLRRYN